MFATNLEGGSHSCTVLRCSYLLFTVQRNGGFVSGFDTVEKKLQKNRFFSGKSSLLVAKGNEMIPYI